MARALIAIDPGSSVLIKVEFKKPVPFDSMGYYDPDTAKLTVIDSLNVVKVNAEDLIPSAMGKYYYEVATAADWESGRYECKVESSKDGVPDTSWNHRCFFVKLGE